MAFQDNVVNGVTLTPENFTNPPLEMGIVPFWFWNGNLEPEEMEWQLRQYHDKGVRSLFIHGRMGLKVPYLSTGWFERVKFVVEKAKEIGIDTWVYDEMDWPSGTAQRQVLKADPELSQRYLELTALQIDGPIFTFLEAHDDRYVNTGDSNPIAAYATSVDEYRTGIRELVDLNKNLSFEKTIPWEAPEGKWMLMYFLEKRAPYYIDTLNPDSTRKFLDLTHEKYRKAVGSEFGATVPGFFTDEPAMYYYHVGLDNYVVPWSKQMFKIFRERRGYDLKPWLPALYRDMGEKTTQIRYDFWRTLTEQYTETYYKQIRDWCEDNGVLFTGHMLFEEHLRLLARCEGNIFRYLEQFHMTGVDHLYPKIGTEEEPEQHVALKLASSAAHHFGSARLLCESMGGTYWNCTLERMKWMGNWEYVLGVNLFNNHGYHYTIEGERKRDWPPSQFYHHTWWKYYDRFTDYIARLSHILSGGRHVAKVLMLYPINSIWTNYMPQERTKVGDLIEQDFHYLTDTLLRLHYDFDYVDEDVLADATVSDGRIRIRDEEFSIFVMPPVTHIKQSTYDKLQEFVEGGGSVIASTLLPIELLETDGDGGIAKANGFLGTDAEQLLENFNNGDGQSFDVQHRNSKGNFYVLTGRGLHRERRKDELKRILNQCAAPDVIISDEDVFYLHRVKDDYNLFFLTNTSQEDKGSVTISFEDVARPELWNPNTGEISPIEVFRVEDGRLVIELDFPPSESHIVVLNGEIPSSHVTETSLSEVSFDGEKVVGFAREAGGVSARVSVNGETRNVTAGGKAARPAITLPDTFDFEIEQDNVLVIEKWRMMMDEEGEHAAHHPEHDDSEWLEVTNGAWEMQLPQERDEATYPVTLWYRTSFEVKDLPPDPRLMIDGFAGSEFQLFVNGREVTDRGKRSWLDAEIKEVDIREHIREGRNSVVVKLVVNRRTDGILDLLKIVGDFGLDGSEEQAYVIAARNPKMRIGDWTKQGCPFYSGTGVYRATIDVPEEYLDGGKIYLEAECGEDVLEVSLNGSDPRVAPWHPYRIDVTDLVKAGPNAIELKVTNTLLNILEGVQQASGLFSPPRLVHEHRYEMAVEGD